MLFSLTPHSWQAALDRNGQALVSPCLRDDRHLQAPSTCVQGCHPEEGCSTLLRLRYTRLHVRTGHRWVLAAGKKECREWQEKLWTSSLPGSQVFLGVQRRWWVKALPRAKASVSPFAADLRVGAVRAPAARRGSLSFRRDCSSEYSGQHFLPQ